MRCPFCSHHNTAVKDSRTTDDQTSIRRRRVCDACGSRFTTFEHVQLRDLNVLKRDGRIQPFDRDKVKKAISKSVHKRQITPDQVEKLVTSIARQLELLGEPAIKSTVIGEMVLESLNEIDIVSYIRFASVYQDFKNIDDFVGILNNIKPKK